MKSAKILNKSEDLSGFQGDNIVNKLQNTEIEINRDVNGCKPYQLTDNFRINHNSHRSNKWIIVIQYETLLLTTRSTITIQI